MASDFLLVGNLLWLDFVNTEPVMDGERVDLLNGFGDLVAWLQAASGLPADEARQAARWEAKAEGQSVLREALALRAALREGAERLAEGKTVGERTVAAINRVLASRPAYRQLIREGKRWVSRERPASMAPAAPPGADRGVGGLAAGTRRPLACPPMRGVVVRAALLRYHQESEPALVQHGGLREPGQGRGLLSPHPRRHAHTPLRRASYSFQASPVRATRYSPAARSKLTRYESM